jgi:hypothetical protein
MIDDRKAADEENGDWLAALKGSLVREKRTWAGCLSLFSGRARWVRQ